MSEPRALLRCSGLRVQVGELLVARDLSFSLYPGQSWCLLGRNGAGKTTLLHTLAGLRAAQGGELWLGDAPLRTLTRRQAARRLGILFQDQTDTFPLSVREKVLQGRHPYLHPWQWESADDHRLVTGLLHRLGLDTLDRRNIQTLSGGERQRVALATVLAQQCALLLLDEPTNHLDLGHRADILRMLTDDCRSAGQGLLMSLHDINLATRFCDHAMLLMGDGEILHGAVEDMLDNKVLEDLYGHALIELTTPIGKVWFPR